MQVVRGYKNIDVDKARPHAVAIGIFDGVHTGHQALLREAMRLAQADGLQSMVYTFDPHPAQVLRPDLAPELIEPLDARLARFDALGIDTALVEHFDLAFAATPAETFIRAVLVERLRARHVVVGAGFTFGAKQRGNVAMLRELGAPLGLTVHGIEHVRLGEGVVSSTKIRALIKAGAVADAAIFLGHPYALFGSVVEGAKRGATLGFPTANLQPRNALLPGRGVYVARAEGVFGRADAVVNVGVAPTFAGATAVLKIEAHLLDYRGPPFYGTDVRLTFLARLRDETRFASIDALKAQINEDVLKARQVLAQAPV